MSPDLLQKLDDCADELAKIKQRIDKDKFDDMVMFLQRYAIIKACGTIEHVVKNLIADKVDAGTSQEIKKYIETNVRDSSTNPRTGNISALLGEFSSNQWKVDFDEQIKLHINEKGSLNALVQLRNDFAHGLSPNTTINAIIQYFAHSRVIVEIVDGIINPT